MKKLLIITLALVLALSLVACGGKDNSGDPTENNSNPTGNNSDSGNPTSNDSDPTNSDDDDGRAFEYGKAFIDKNLNGDYWIIYKMTTYDTGDSYNIEIRKVNENYYMLLEDVDQIFIKNGSTYDLYEYNYSQAIYEKAESNLAPAYVQTMINTFDGYMKVHSTNDGKGFKKVGTGTVAGRNCDKFDFEWTNPANQLKYRNTYYIDKATGVNLKLTMDVIGEGKKQGLEYEAEKFQTSDVVLPAYK